MCQFIGQHCPKRVHNIQKIILRASCNCWICRYYILQSERTGVGPAQNDRTMCFHAITHEQHLTTTVWLQQFTDFSGRLRDNLRWHMIRLYRTFTVQVTCSKPQATISNCRAVRHTQSSECQPSNSFMEWVTHMPSSKTDIPNQASPTSLTPCPLFKHVSQLKQSAVLFPFISIFVCMVATVCFSRFHNFITTRPSSPNSMPFIYEMNPPSKIRCNH